MKKHYVRELPWRATEESEARYVLVSGHYHRPVRTFGEIRRKVADDNDHELRDLKVYPRRRRSNGMLDSWNDFSISRNYGKSWKDYTRHTKQWMRDGRPPRDTTPTRLLLAIESLLNDLEVNDTP